MKKIVYLKEVTSYNDVIKKAYSKMPLFLKKIIFIYKNIFNIITKNEDSNVWILPIKEKHQFCKIEKIIKRISKNSNNIQFVLSKELKDNGIDKIMRKYQVGYITEDILKKLLVKSILDYICNIQKKEINTLDVTVLVNNTSDLNMYILEELAYVVRSLKVVSLKIYKFRKLEEKLYNESGIALQFSNSYKKSLEKSEIIINLDFSNIEINEYEIFNEAIIINCIEENIKVKTKMFEGIVINSYNIDFKKEIINKFKKIGILNEYTKFSLYSSLVYSDNNIKNLCKKIEEDNVVITNLSGNNGIINKKEFKIINKKLDKKLKTE